MKHCRSTKRDRYCITIASQTHAFKKARSLSVSRRSIVAVLLCASLAVIVSVSAALITTFQVYQRQSQADTLTRQVNERIALLQGYEAQIAMCQQPELCAAATDASGDQDAVDASVLAQEDMPGSALGVTENTALAIAVRDAVMQINGEFQAAVDEQIAVAKLGTPADEVEIVYDGDVEGDSDTVNNWADVLATFTVLSGYDLTTLQTITEDDFALLERVYDDMNRLEISRISSTETAEGEAGATITKLTLCVTIKSMNCLEYAEQCGWDGDKKDCLEKLMRPDYYMTFAALLGVDLYDGLNSEELQAIIAGLEPGLIGTRVVEAALTRVGDPYSRGRRGSSDYVDCSYFTYWAYKQAGITIPTSSVEQAKYCYFNGYEVEMDDLQPGDLLYWSKASCNCGRWREIHHAGLYIGNGMIVDASSSKGCVVIRKLWSGGGWRLAMAARPYEEQTFTTPVSSAGLGS